MFVHYGKPQQAYRQYLPARQPTLALPSHKTLWDQIGYWYPRKYG